MPTPFSQIQQQYGDTSSSGTGTMNGTQPIPLSQIQSQFGSAPDTTHAPAALSSSQYLLGLVKKGYSMESDLATGAAKGSIQGIESTVGALQSGGAAIEGGLDKLTGTQNDPLTAGAKEGAAVTQTAVSDPALAGTNKTQNVGQAVGQVADALVPVDKGLQIGGDALKESPMAAKVASIFGKSDTPGLLATKEAKDAWDIVAPKMTKATEGAYRDADAMTKQGIFKGSKPTPLPTDKKVLDAVAPLVKDGTLKKGADEAAQHKTLALAAKDAGDARKAYLKANNAPFDLGDLQSELADAKSKTKAGLAFAGDDSLEKTYDQVMEKFTQGINGGKISDIDAATTKFGQYAKSIGAFKKTPEGMLQPTQAVKQKAARDMYFAGRKYIEKAMGSDSQYQALLDKESGLITAAKRVSEKATGTESLGKIQSFIKKHPLLAGTVGGTVAVTAGGVLDGITQDLGKSLGL